MIIPRRGSCNSSDANEQYLHQRNSSKITNVAVPNPGTIASALRLVLIVVSTLVVRTTPFRISVVSTTTTTRRRSGTDNSIIDTRGCRPHSPTVVNPRRAKQQQAMPILARFAQPNTNTGDIETTERRNVNLSGSERVDEVGANSTITTATATATITTTSTIATMDADNNTASIPFFAAVERKEEQTNGDFRPNAAATPEQEQQNGLGDRLLSRRGAFRYGAVVTGAALITGMAHTQTSVEKKLPPPPYRLSLLPQPVLPISKDATGTAPGGGKMHATPKAPQPQSQSLQKPQLQQQKPQPQQQLKPQPPPPKATGTVSKTASTSSPSTPLPAKPLGPSAVGPGVLEPVNLTRVASETNINVTINCEKMCASIDSSNFAFNRVETPKVPKWLPSFLAPKSQIVKQYSNCELLIAATVAGSVCEMGRTSLLYPLSTIKTRIMADRNHHHASYGPTTTFSSFLDEVRALGTNIRRKADDGDLYAGISPTLLVSVPATGIYYGVRDVTKRMLYMTPLGTSAAGDAATTIALAGALVGDVVSLCFRTPSTALAMRLQNQNATAGDWLGDSVRRLPMVILTDLPYLLSKIVLNKLFIQGSLPVSNYALYAVLAAVVAGVLTTPFDVAQTRILLGERLIASEGDGGVRNLFSGWLERVVYLGIGRAWLEPIQLIGYIGIRDAVLLEWF
eukprot:jgi/Psemu1/289357/fgenesh1_pg.350_\